MVREREDNNLDKEASRDESETSLVKNSDDAMVHEFQEEVTLVSVVSSIKELINKHFDNNHEKHKRSIELEAKYLTENARITRLLVYGFLFIATIVLLFAAILMFLGKEDMAIEFIKLVALIIGVGFGGYGLGVSRQKKDADE